MGKDKKRELCFFDTETTGLPEAKGTSNSLQPYITEICIIRTDHKFNIIGEYTSLIKVPIEIPTFITRITNIDNKMVNKFPYFNKHIKKINKVLKGADILVAQNLRFDKDMIEIEYSRFNKKIVWPKTLFCTVEQSMHYCGMRLKSTELFDYTGGREIKNIHRARADVIAMIEYFQHIASGYMPDHLIGVRNK